MSVYEELLEKKKQKRIKYELEQTKKDNQNINNKLSELKYVHSIALEQNRECNKKIDCYVLEIENLNNIIYKIEMYIKRYTWLDGKINSDNLLEYIQKLKEGK